MTILNEKDAQAPLSAMLTGLFDEFVGEYDKFIQEQDLVDDADLDDSILEARRQNFQRYENLLKDNESLLKEKFPGQELDFWNDYDLPNTDVIEQIETFTASGSEDDKSDLYAGIQALLAKHKQAAQNESILTDAQAEAIRSEGKDVFCALVTRWAMQLQFSTELTFEAVEEIVRQAVDNALAAQKEASPAANLFGLFKAKGDAQLLKQIEQRLNGADNEALLAFLSGLSETDVHEMQRRLEVKKRNLTTPPSFN